MFTEQQLKCEHDVATCRNLGVESDTYYCVKCGAMATEYWGRMRHVLETPRQKAELAQFRKNQPCNAAPS